jgi:hypothetical protein
MRQLTLMNQVAGLVLNPDIGPWFSVSRILDSQTIEAH